MSMYGIRSVRRRDESEPAPLPPVGAVLAHPSIHVSEPAECRDGDSVAAVDRNCAATRSVDGLIELTP